MVTLAPRSAAARIASPPQPEPISSTCMPGPTVARSRMPSILRSWAACEVVARLEPGGGVGQGRVEEQLEELVGQVVVPVDVLPGARRGVLLARRDAALPGAPQPLQRPRDQHGHPAGQHLQRGRQLVGCPRSRAGRAADHGRPRPSPRIPAIRSSGRRSSRPRRSRSARRRRAGRRSCPAGRSAAAGLRRPSWCRPGRRSVIGRRSTAALASRRAMPACTGTRGTSNRPGQTPADGRGTTGGRLGLSNAMDDPFSRRAAGEFGALADRDWRPRSLAERWADGDESGRCRRSRYG